MGIFLLFGNLPEAAQLCFVALIGLSQQQISLLKPKPANLANHYRPTFSNP